MAKETFGDRVRRFRTEAKMSRRDLATAAGIRYSTLADIEDKHRETSKHIVAIAAALNKAPRDLLGSEPDLPDTAPPAPSFWPFSRVSPQDINDLDRIERSHLERALEDALAEVKTERRRHRRSG